jgi:hypothetical protein
MSTSEITTRQLESLLSGLEKSLSVTKDPETQNEKGYPYCYGYLEASVSNAIYELKAILKNQ